MKPFYSYGLCAALFFGSLGAQAQTQNRPAGPAYPLGTNQALVKMLEPQAKAGAVRQAPPTVSLRVSASQAFTGQVNYREDLSTTGEYVVGEIQGVPGSSFSVRVEGPKVEGTIILRATRRAYRYSSDAQGNASVQEVDINQVICIDLDKPVGSRQKETSPASPSADQKTVGSQNAVALLQSFPGARGCLMLDFDGQYVSGTPWNNGNPISAAPSDIVNDNAKIQAFWELVSEDFRPFSLNVTTDEAVFNSYPRTMRRRCIVTPTNTAAPGAGGVAYVGSFSSNDDNPCWVFMSDPKSGGEAASHELGHTLGLSHDGRLNPTEGYYDGRDNAGAWAPIMGAGYYKAVTHWSRGEYNRANNQEDDLAIISSTRFNVGYRNDDHTNSPAGATALARSGTSLAGQGIIERTTDQDYFSFTTGGGTVSLNVNTVARYGDLDIVARLFNSAGGLLGTYDTAGGGKLNVAFSTSLAAGTYYLQVDGTSSGNPATDGYSDYGSLGTFTIAGTAPAGGTTPPPAAVATLYLDCSYAGTAAGLAVGDYTLSQLQARGISNDNLSSLQVSSGYEVQLFADDNFTGASLTLTASSTCLVDKALGTSTWNDVASSLRVRTATPGTPNLASLIQAEAYSAMNGVQVEPTSDTDGGQNVGYIDAGDWLAYNNITFPTAGTYLIEYRVASLSGGTLSSDLNAGAIQLGRVTIPATGGWQSWRTVSQTVNVATAGTYNFGVFAQTGGWNLNWLRISGGGAAGAVALVPALSSPAKAAARLELYPNPVADRLQLRAAQDLTGSQFQILDATGHSVASGAGDAGSLDVSRLKSGVYLLVLTTGTRERLTQRFVK